MASLIALTPCAGLLPMTEGEIGLTEVTHDRLMSVAPFAGQDKAVSDRLQAQVGSTLPAPNRKAGSVQWFGHGTWLVSETVDLEGLAAVSDQTDAWATVQIAGQGVEDVLARLVPVDLRASVFKKGHTARTMLAHMSVAVTRVGPAAFEIMVMRSMAATLVHDVQVAMRGVAAR